MIQFLTWALMVLGATYAITTSFVLALPRILFARLGTAPRYFIYCPFCVSFWAGAVSRFDTNTDWITTGFSMFAGGLMATGLVVVVKGAWPDALVPPYELEQGARAREPDDDEQPQTMIIGTASDPRSVPCEHKWSAIGPDTRCLVCGMDKP